MVAQHAEGNEMLVSEQIDHRVNRPALNTCAAILALAAGLMLVLELPHMYSARTGYDVIVAAAVCAEIMYGMALLTRPWRYDQLGRARPHPEANARPWHAVGIIFVVIPIVSYTLTPATTTSRLALVFGVLLFACLALLLRRPATQTRSQEPSVT